MSYFWEQFECSNFYAYECLTDFMNNKNVIFVQAFTYFKVYTLKSILSHSFENILILSKTYITSHFAFVLSDFR